uniref:Superoxide dismutase n=1 Tax=Globodera rostochiensis TaxID=31243 RepID=A0A914ICK2_GLORO
MAFCSLCPWTNTSGKVKIARAGTGICDCQFFRYLRNGREMFDRLLNTNQHWPVLVGAAGVEPDCKAFMGEVKEYFTEATAKQKAVCALVGDTDPPNVKGMVTFTLHGVLNAVFSSSQALRKFLLPRAVRWQEVRLSKYINLKTMHDRVLSNAVWCYSLIGVAGLDEDCKAFMDGLKNYCMDPSLLKQKAVCVLVGDTDPNVKGLVTFSQDSVSTQVAITGQINGLSPGAHGFHVHESGDLSNRCATAGPHFNPTKKSHGGPIGALRHVGLLGHVHAGADGVAKFGFTHSSHNIVARTLVVHKLEDVLGHGLYGEEQKNKMTTGNAGSCLACGVIMMPGIGGHKHSSMKMKASPRALIVRDWKPDVVYLVQFPRTHIVPSPSPFALKLETWLRINGLKYRNVDNEFKKTSSKGQIPFIELNGRQFADSNLVMDHLRTNFKLPIDSRLSTYERALCRSFTVLIEESLFRCLQYDRSIDIGWIATENGWAVHLRGLQKFLFQKFKVKKFQGFLKSVVMAQGYGRHSETEVEEIAKKDLIALSTFLGDKHFLFGEHPTTLDATLFGHLVQFTDVPLHSKAIKPIRRKNPEQNNEDQLLQGLSKALFLLCRWICKYWTNKKSMYYNN